MRWLGRRPGESGEFKQFPDLPRHNRVLADSSFLTRSLVLKQALSTGERGVLLVQFEYNWFRLLAQVPRWEEIEKRYDVIWGTSWSPTDFVLLDWILQRSNGPVVVLPSHPLDAKRFSIFDPRIRCPSVLSASDWLDPTCFDPLPWYERDIDILMVANWAPFKRHHELFNALRSMPNSLRVVLVGQPEAGHTLHDIQKLAADLRVPQALEFHERLPVEEVHQLQCRAKTALILSRREGSCVAAVEALFAGAALGMRADAHVGALSYVNEHTGKRFTPGKLADELPDFLENARHLDPRRWAEDHITCHHAGKKLNDFMKNLSLERGLPWTQDLAPMRWNPYPELMSDEAKSVHEHEWASLARLFPGPFRLSA